MQSNYLLLAKSSRRKIILSGTELAILLPASADTSISKNISIKGRIYIRILFIDEDKRKQFLGSFLLQA